MSLQKLLQTPGQKVTFEYDPEGFSRIPGDRVYRALLAIPMGSKAGWCAPTVEALMDAIEKDAS